MHSYEVPAEHCPLSPFSSYKEAAFWMNDFTWSQAFPRPGTLQGGVMGSAPAQPHLRLAVKSGHLSNSASSFQMAWPALSFDRAINQSLGKTEALSQCHPARTQTQNPGPLQGLCGSQTEPEHRKRARCSSLTCYLETGTRKATSPASPSALQNRLRADATPPPPPPPLFRKTEEISNRKLLQEDSDLWLTRRLISTHRSRMQACVSDKIYITANTFKRGVKENTDRENKQQLHTTTGEPNPYYKHWQSMGKQPSSPALPWSEEQVVSNTHISSRWTRPQWKRENCETANGK